LVPHDAGLLQANEVARKLVGSTAKVSRLLTGGRNSRIWHVRSGSSAFALKQYPARRDDDLRDRLATETGALRLMEHYQIDTVPRVVAVDNERGFALLSWIDGRDVVEIGDGDIDAAVTFLTAIHRLRATPWAAKQPHASEACLCGTEIVHQITTRLERLTCLSGEPDLIDFLDGSLSPAIAKTSGEARVLAAAAGLDFGAELPHEWRSLVPSDFGFHNSVRRSDGSLAFLDFEYFGWDDPVKLTADMLLHPGRTLPVAQRARFRRSAELLYGQDSSFVQRLRVYLPLFGLRWVLILLNEFIPERWRGRALAGGGESWSGIKATQLAHAKEFFASLSERVED
jgi:hypothetical protein